MGRASGVQQGGVTLVAGLWCCMCGRGQEGAMALAPLSDGFQSLSLPPVIKLGPSGADSRVGGWACAHSKPLWVSPMNSPVRLGVSPAASSTPTGVFTQRFEALFSCAGALGCVVCFASPPFLPVYLCMNVGLQGLPATSLLGPPAAALL